MTTHTEPLFGVESESTLPAVVIRRALEVRRVHNSDQELRLSIDVPATQDLSLKLQHPHRRSSSIRLEGQLLNGACFSKTLDLPSSSYLDYSQVHAQLSKDGVLDIVAPKSNNGGGEPQHTTREQANFKMIPVM